MHTIPADSGGDNRRHTIPIDGGGKPGHAQPQEHIDRVGARNVANGVVSVLIALDGEHGSEGICPPAWFTLRLESRVWGLGFGVWRLGSQYPGALYAQGT